MKKVDDGGLVRFACFPIKFLFYFNVFIVIIISRVSSVSWWWKGGEGVLNLTTIFIVPS